MRYIAYMYDTNALSTFKDLETQNAINNNYRTTSSLRGCMPYVVFF